MTFVDTIRYDEIVKFAEKLEKDLIGDHKYIKRELNSILYPIVSPLHR